MMFVGLQRMLRTLFALAFLVVLMALPVAALLDVGPEREVRFSLFPSVLTLLDPFVRACFARSLLIALVIALGSRLLGVSLGRLLFGSRLIGRSAGRIFFVGPIVFPAAFLALGLDGLSDWEAPVERICRAINRPLLPWGFSEWRWAEARAWIGWAWVGVVQGVALVLLAMEWGLRRVDLAWEESARASGLPPRVIWRRLVWPVIRPDVARAVGLVFTLNLVEAGIPRILDLRRSIGFQVVELSMQSDPFPRLAAFALMTFACLVIALLLIRFRLGTTGDSGAPLADLAAFGDRHALARPWLAEAGAIVLLLGWFLVAWLPIAGLARQVLLLMQSATQSSGEGSGGAWFLLAKLSDPRTTQLLFNTLVVGSFAALVLLVLDLLDLVGRYRGRGLRTLFSYRGILFPRLLLAVAVLGVPRILELLDYLVGTGRKAGIWGSASRALDPIGAPLRLLLVAVCFDVVRTYGSVTSRRVKGRTVLRDREDAARLFGIDERRARRLAKGGDARSLVLRLILVGLAAATATSPAIVLAPTEEGRTLTTGIITMATDSPESHARAVILAFCLCVSLLVAWIVGVLSTLSRSRGVFGPVARWTHLDAEAEDL